MTDKEIVYNVQEAFAAEIQLEPATTKPGSGKLKENYSREETRKVFQEQLILEIIEKIKQL